MGARFREGDRVRVKDEARPGHIRTPSYIMGKTGVVSRVHGSFRNPEQLAYGQDGLPKVPLYCVAFDAQHVWGRPTGSDKVVVDVYEHWLEPGP
jgi:hypothetical protein